MGEGWIGNLGLADVNIAWINSKVQLYSTGNYIQYPVINLNGNEYEKEHICVCVCVCITLLNRRN